MNIPEAVEHLISQSPFLDEALADKLINVSSLARTLKPDIERLARKNVQESAVIMAINRRPHGTSLKISKGIRSFMQNLGDLIVRSGLSEHTYENTANLTSCQRRLMEEATHGKELFCTISQGVYETTIVASSSLNDRIRELFAGENCLSHNARLSSVTIRLPKDNTQISGIYYYILRHLAWAGINICQVISTSNEISIVVSEHDVQRAFPILMNLKNQ